MKMHHFAAVLVCIWVGEARGVVIDFEKFPGRTAN